MIGSVIWAAAILLFLVGDLSTTLYGLQVGAVESNPIPRMLIDETPLAFVGLKVGVIAIAGVVYRVAPDPYRIGIPIGLALLGATATAWNLWVIA